MTKRFNNVKEGNCYFVTTTFREWTEYGKVDGFYQGMAESLRFCLKKYSAQLAAYVFMPSHIHLVLFVEGKALSGFMRDFKKYIAQKVAVDLDIKEAHVWMPRYDRVTIVSKAAFMTKIEYIHNNPVKGYLVEVAKNWRWSSASAYISNDRGEIPVFKEW